MKAPDLPFALLRGLTLLMLLMLATLPATRAASQGDVVRSEQHNFKVNTLVSGLEHPWSMAFLPDGRWLITERPGRLRIVENGRLKPEPVAGLPKIRAHGQGGLLDVILHPDYARNGWLYLSYAAAGGEGAGAGVGTGVGTEVIRAKLTGNRLSQVEHLFRMVPKSGGPVHFGGRLVFDRQHRLYITLGDRGRMEEAQQLSNHLGSVVRLGEDGGVPGDNPFRRHKGARSEIFSYGHRNIQGAALHPATGQIWTHEHGPQGGDEINILQPGVNYGWPVITYGVNYGTGTPIGQGTHRAGMAQPLHQWTPSIAPSGMAFYAGDAFPRWRGNLLIGALKYQRLVRLSLDGNKVVGEEHLLKGIDRIRDVRVGPDGRVYLLTDAPDGRLLRLEPVP